MKNAAWTRAPGSYINKDHASGMEGGMLERDPRVRDDKRPSLVRLVGL